MKSPALAINNCVLAGRSQESETDLEFASTCANFGISVQKIEEGDIYGLGSSVMSSILSNDAQTIILLPPCWRRKVTKPIRVLTYLF